MKTILSFDNVTLKKGKREILKNINWKIKEKENWAILGLNGAGKTTMLKMIHGDLWPSAGKLEVLGGVFGHTNIPNLKKRIGWVSTALQDWLHPSDTAEFIVLSGKYATIGVYEKYAKKDLEKAKSYLANIGGAKLIGKPYRILSQGERQLVMLARALMTQPELLILDEPCNGLDLFAREHLLESVSQLSNQPNSPALLMVSHYTEELLPCFENVMMLKQGEVFAQGKRKKLLNNENLALFYDHPVKIFKAADQRVIVYPAKQF
ncbi:ABC transporter ATP-binding protein [Liquorilactobacillus sicerae]|uniref:ABC transporter ATP-binding protein n=1 Tax=Liquorilactobacillus sicerae TaxID=1416943 RepID=UPI002480C0D4|nr:ABC transporter ATP-binding protein [Liquorilactobacillus sicerae]